MKTKKKKLIKLESELKVYNKIAIKIARLLDAKLSIEDLDDYIFLKIQKVEEEINILNFVDDSEKPKELTPEYGPNDFISYNGVQNCILEVHHREKKYKIQSIHDKIDFISWSDEKIKNWK